MNAITSKLQNDAFEKFKPLAKQLAAEGCSKDDIVKAFKNQMRCRVNKIYPKDLTRLKDCISLEDVKKANSKIELIFYRMMDKSGIKFLFQYQIGPYTADYLIMNFLVVELDGPQHKIKHDEQRDNYMRKMGYKIIRIPTWVLMSDPGAAIESIKEVIQCQKKR